MLRTMFTGNPSLIGDQVAPASAEWKTPFVEVAAKMFVASLAARNVTLSLSMPALEGCQDTPRSVEAHTPENSVPASRFEPEKRIAWTDEAGSPEDKLDQLTPLSVVRSTLPSVVAAKTFPTPLTRRAGIPAVKRPLPTFVHEAPSSVERK